LSCRAPLTLAALLLGVLAPRAASAVQSAELYRTQAYLYGRFEARVQFAPGEGVVSSFFLWKDGSSSTTSWNELDFEKTNATCRLQTNIWTGTGTQSAEIDTPAFNICAGYHTYAFEWTPDYIAWFIDDNQIRKVTGASVAEYTQNAAKELELRRHARPFDIAREPIHRLGPILVLRQRRLRAAMARGVQRWDGADRVGRRDLGIAVQPLDPQSGQRHLRKRRRRALDDGRQCDRLHRNASGV